MNEKYWNDNYGSDSVLEVSYNRFGQVGPGDPIFIGVNGEADDYKASVELSATQARELIEHLKNLLGDEAGSEHP